MANIIKGGKNIYGFDIGVLMLDSRFPRIVGDVGNAHTYNFPVLYKTVEGYNPHKVVIDLTEDDILPFIKAAKELEKEGVKAITTSCGFLALFQKELTASVSVPVFSSSLIQLPIISRIINPSKKVLILTANSKTLSKKHLESVCGNLDNLNYEIIGTESKTTFTWFTVNNYDEVDLDLCKKDILETLDVAFSKNNDYGAILLECTNMPPYSNLIRQRYKLPVFDFITFINYIKNTISVDYGGVI